MRSKVRSSTRARRRHGFTLIELIIGSALALILVTGAFSFAQTQVKELSFTTERVYMTEVGRTTLSMLTSDVRHAGAGVGYTQDGTFGGLRTGSFVVTGATFNANNGNLLALESAPSVPTDDIGIVSARGGYASIADFSNTGTGQLCKGANIKNGALVMLRTETGLSATAAVLSNIADVPICTVSTCIGGCQSFSWTPNPLWSSDPDASTANYFGGEIEDGLAQVVWFVDATDPSRPGVGSLRRAVFDGTLNCTGRNYLCGDIVAQNVETVQMDVWRFDSVSGVWVNMTGQPLLTSDRLRVDLELVVRARTSDAKMHDPVSLRLEPAVCLPASCSFDTIERVTFRASVDVLNSGRLSIR